MALATAAWGHDGLAFSGKDMRELVEGLFGHNGIAALPGFTSGFKVTAQGSPNTTVAVAAGKAIVQATGSGLLGDYHVWNDASLNSTGFTATSTNGRKDRLILRVTAGVPALEIVQGTASASPAEPSITGDNYLELALITMPGSTTNITNAMITDRRVFVGKWSEPWGRVATPVTWVSDTSTTTSVVNVAGASITFTAVANRLYKFRYSLHNFSTALGDSTRYYMTNPSNAVTGLPGTVDVLCASTTAASYFEINGYETAIPAGSTTRKLMLNRAAGSGTVHAFADATRPGSLTVEDGGPNGNPD